MPLMRWTFNKEPEAVRTKYGSKIGESSFANNCLVARRLAERGVRFISFTIGDGIVTVQAQRML